MFVNIPEYNGRYQINESGVIINNNGHVMRTAVSNSGYLRTALENANDTIGRTNESIHRLVAKTFIPNPDNLPIVLHRDNDKLNNHVSNLKWGTQAENVEQAFNDGLRSRSIKENIKRVHKYTVFNEETGDSIVCGCRSDVSDLIGYAESSLKNMIGNGRKISLGPYKNYQIRKEESFLRNMVRIIE